MRTPKLPQSLPKALTIAEAKATLSTIADMEAVPWIAARDTAVLALCYGAGLRIAEALSLSRADLDGNSLRVDPDTHKGDGGFELDSPTTSVSVDILNPAGTTVGSVKLGPQGAGSHGFDLDVPVAAQGQALTFRVNALNNDAPLDAKSFAFNSINAVSSANGKLAVELDDGRRVAYADVRAFY